jgi:hypothetical protein
VQSSKHKVHFSLFPWRQNPKVHHRVHNSPPPVPILSQLNPLHPPANLPKIHSDPILPSTPRSSQWSFSFGLSHQNLVAYTFLSSPMRPTCPAHLILLDLIVTSSLLGPDILLRTLFSNTLSICCSLNVRDQVSHPYKTTDRILSVFYTLKHAYGTIMYIYIS